MFTADFLCCMYGQKVHTQSVGKPDGWKGVLAIDFSMMLNVNEEFCLKLPDFLLYGLSLAS